MKVRRRETREIRIGNRHIKAVGLSNSGFLDYYHQAMTIGWLGFFGWAAMVFVGFNSIFSALYVLFPGSVANVPPDKPWHVIFFSIETLATVGYGDMHPQTEWGHWVASLETFSGLILTAVLTGLIFARFSRPIARVMFSDKAVIGQFDGQQHLMIRVANARLNMISDAVARLWLLATAENAEGRRFRRFYELKLERVENPSFVLSWTLFHRIDAQSPIYGWDRDRMAEVEMGLIVTVTGTDESVAQELRSRRTYDWNDIAFDQHFVDLMSNDDQGRLVLDYAQFHMTEADEPSDLEVAP